MKVYIVRHGESDANLTQVHQNSQTPLTENGKKQAQAVAERFKNIPIEVIISSSLNRAKATAEAIQHATGVNHEIDDVIKEMTRPTEFIGLRMGSDETKAIFEEMIAHENDPEWHYSDEENFHDVVNRTHDTLKMLEARSEENIALVSHSIFMRVLIGVMTFGKNMTPQMLRDLGNHFKINNTGITVLKYENDKWDLLTWNDHAHLG
jgi:broad specificity phosphatase PhoE